MTADIRTAAQREIEGRSEIEIEGEELFVDGAEWAAARVTPTREQIARKLYETCWGDMVTWEDDKRLFYDYAEAVLALMKELAEGGSDGEH